MDRAAESIDRDTAAKIDREMRAILQGNGDARLAEQSESLAAAMQDLEQTALRVKGERDLAVSALKAAAHALRSPDEHRRRVVAELVGAALAFMGEAP